MMQIETSRLILREFQQEDYRELAPILADPQVMQFATMGTLSVRQTQARIESFMTSYNKFGYGKWATILKESNELVGYCGIVREQIDDQDEIEIGYRFDKSIWGKGLATESGLAAIEYGFDQFKFPYILGCVEPENIRSVKVLENLGMHYKSQTVLKGVNMDIYRLDNSKK